MDSTPAEFGRLGNSSTARVERALFHRARSTSSGDPDLIHPSPTHAQMVPKQAGDWTVLHCARRETVIHLYSPTKLAYFPSVGRVRMLVYVRPSNEALLRARVPGAHRATWVPFQSFHHLLSPSIQSGRPPTRGRLGGSFTARVGRALFHRARSTSKRSPLTALTSFSAPLSTPSPPSL